MDLETERVQDTVLQRIFFIYQLSLFVARNIFHHFESLRRSPATFFQFPGAFAMSFQNLFALSFQEK